jgi:hypothetical protein
MTQTDFYSLLENDSLLKEIQVAELDGIIAEYPFASNLHILKARVLHDQQDEGFKSALENAAARTISRTKLYQLIEGKPTLEFIWHEVPESESIIQETNSEVLDDPESILNFESEITQTITNDIKPEEEIGIKNSETFTKAGDSETENLENNASENGNIFPENLEIIEEKSIAEIPRILPGKNDFSFSFVKVSAGKSDQKEIQLVPSQVYDISLVNGGRKSKSKKKEDSIIDKFLESSPSISPPTIDFGQTKSHTDLAANSGKLMEEIITENMAMIYLKQKNYAKALDIYRKLKLKNPEKGDYFAALIKNLENKIV